MFEAWNKDAFEGFLEHIYTQKVNSGEWVDRFIAEQEGTGQTHQGMKTLERKIAQLQSQIEQRNQGNQQAQAQQAQQQAFTEYNKHIHSLFDQIKFAEADRRWIVADLNAKVASDPKIITAIKGGNVNAVNGLFKAAIREYATRDKQTAQKTAEKIDLQSQKKPPISGGAVSQEGALPDDIRQVPKGQEDNWMEQQFSKLARLVKK